MIDREKVLGRDLFDVFPDNPEEVDATGTRNLRASLDRVLKTNAADTMAIQKYDIRRPDGSFEERHWSPVDTPVLSKSGQVIYIIHKVEDVTEFVKMRILGKEKTRIAEELQNRAAQFELELFQRSQDLQMANHQLAAANAEIASFSYSVSHDLRAPLRSITGFSMALLEDCRERLDDASKEHLDRIVKAAKRMSELIDGLLDLSQLTRKQISIESCEPFPALRRDCRGAPKEKSRPKGRVRDREVSTPNVTGEC